MLRAITRLARPPACGLRGAASSSASVQERVLRIAKEQAEANERRKLKRKQEEEARERRLAVGRERLRRDRIESAVRADMRRREAEKRERELLVAESVTLALHGSREAVEAAARRVARAHLEA